MHQTAQILVGTLQNATKQMYRTADDIHRLERILLCSQLNIETMMVMMIAGATYRSKDQNICNRTEQQKKKRERKVNICVCAHLILVGLSNAQTRQSISIHFQLVASNNNRANSIQLADDERAAKKILMNRPTTKQAGKQREKGTKKNVHFFRPVF